MPVIVLDTVETGPPPPAPLQLSIFRETIRFLLEVNALQVSVGSAPGWGLWGVNNLYPNNKATSSNG